MKPRTIYIIRKRALGDVLWAEPVIRLLSKKYKKIIVYTKFTELFKNYPEKNVKFVSDLNFLQKCLIRLDNLLNLNFFSINLEKSYEASPKQHILHAYQKKAGIPLSSEYPKVYLGENEKNSNARWNQKYVVVNISTLSNTQNYRTVYGINWPKIIDYIAQKGYKVIEIGTPPGMISEIYQTTSVREMIGLISKATFFIGLDSGPSHIAASFNVPSIIFFGAVNPEYRHFMNQFKGYILQQPCTHAGCYHNKKIEKEHICPLYGTTGTPVCCIFTDSEIQTAINKLIEKYL